MSVKRYEWVACDEHSCHCDVVESAEGDMVDYEDYAALEARCAALAAENAGLKAAAEFATASDMWEELGGNVMRYQYQEWYSDRLKSAMTTPATDAFLAEVRAQGVEMFADNRLCPDLDDTIREFAALIRKGVQS
ncbi:TPA: hypothetical protein ONC47_004314 [Enterobacter cloacae]|nr:hypothetical protein [Enterobacter cloacae]